MKASNDEHVIMIKNKLDELTKWIEKLHETSVGQKWINRSLENVNIDVTHLLEGLIEVEGRGTDEL